MEQLSNHPNYLLLSILWIANIFLASILIYKFIKRKNNGKTN